MTNGVFPELAINISWLTLFFFDHLGKGVYVLEYSYRVSRAGTYETGLATMQCAYAPEYASHSASMTIIIK